MNALYLILFIVAGVCFALAAFFANTVPPRVNLIAAGLLAWVLVPLIDAARDL